MHFLGILYMKTNPIPNQLLPPQLPQLPHLPHLPLHLRHLLLHLIHPLLLLLLLFLLHHLIHNVNMQFLRYVLCGWNQIDGLKIVMLIQLQKKKNLKRKKQQNKPKEIDQNQIKCRMNLKNLWTKSFNCL